MTSDIVEVLAIYFSVACWQSQYLQQQLWPESFSAAKTTVRPIVSQEPKKTEQLSGVDQIKIA